MNVSNNYKHGLNKRSTLNPFTDNEEEEFDEQSLETESEMDAYLDLDKVLSQRRVPKLAKGMFSSVKNLKKNILKSTVAETETAIPVPKEKRKWRLLERDNPFFQSSGSVRLKHLAKGETRRQLISLYQSDWFHVLLGIPIWKSMMLLCTLITFFLLLFSGVYFVVDRSSDGCHLGDLEDGVEYIHITFQSAFGFSLITASTVGYGFISTGDAFNTECPAFVVAVYFQVLQSLMMNAFVVGVILQQMGRANLRAHQVVFSNKAILKCVKNKFYFSFQVFDLDRRHPVVEAHVRLYCITHPTPENGGKFGTKMMRIQNPNDDLGGVLFLSLPCHVMHNVDSHSPLLPNDFASRFLKDDSDNYNLMTTYDSACDYGVVLRDEDCLVGERSAFTCATCGESYHSKEHFFRHVRYSQLLEKNDLENCENEPHSHMSIDLSTFTKGLQSQPLTDETIDNEIQLMKQHLIKNRVEIVVVVEGIEARSSNTFQARYSYTADDIEFDHEFEDCILKSKDGAAKVDLNAFHCTKLRRRNCRTETTCSKL